MMFVVLSVRALLLVTFATAAGSKMRSRDALRTFSAGLLRMGIVPADLAKPLALLVALSETSTSVLLAITRTTTWGFAGAGLLLLLFTAATARAVRSGVQVPCMCFGMGEVVIAPRHLVRNMVLLFLALIGFASDVVISNRHLATGSAILSVAVGALVALMFVRWDDLTLLFLGEPRASN
jgi:hypothetical protein